MTFVSCSVSERFVNPLFECFDGGEFILSSYRDIEEDFAHMRIFLEGSPAAPETVEAAKAALRRALDVVGVDAVLEVGEMPDEDWKFAYRRHFKTEKVGSRLLIVPEWELEGVRKELEQSGNPENRLIVTLDPGMAFGTGKHETTRACLEFIDEVLAALERPEDVSFLDMGCGSGVLSIAAAKLGCRSVRGFDVDMDAVEASRENAGKNGVAVVYEKFALGRAKGGAAEHEVRTWDFVAANILGPLLIRFADEIVQYAGDRLILSGILNELYPEVRACYEARGFREESVKTLGEWTTGLFRAPQAR